MDDNSTVLEEQRVEPDSKAVRDTRPKNVISVEDVRLLSLESLEQVGELLDKYQTLDTPKERSMIFLDYLTQRRDAWFVETGDRGLVYLTNIFPGLAANVHIVFWDGLLRKDRREVVLSVLNEAFEQFALKRVGAIVPHTNMPLRHMYRKMGFILEGVIREGWIDEKGPLDAFMFGLLKKELPCPVLRIPAISSVPAS